MYLVMTTCVLDYLYLNKVDFKKRYFLTHILFMKLILTSIHDFAKYDFTNVLLSILCVFTHQL